jgi:hypothetical protein
VSDWQRPSAQRLGSLASADAASSRAESLMLQLSMTRALRVESAETPSFLKSAHRQVVQRSGAIGAGLGRPGG